MKINSTLKAILVMFLIVLVSGLVRKFTNFDNNTTYILGALTGAYTMSAYFGIINKELEVEIEKKLDSIERRVEGLSRER